MIQILAPDHLLCVVIGYIRLVLLDLGATHALRLVDRKSGTNGDAGGGSNVQVWYSATFV